MPKVRFHLAAGPHFMQWQIKENDDTIYVEPNKFTLQLFGCKLINNRRTAERIYQGANKDVCAWIECERAIITNPVTPYSNCLPIAYNPRKQPFWVNDNNDNIDYNEYDRIVSNGRKLFVVKAL